jgi:DNA primase
VTGPIERAKHGHRLADVARRTGITVPAGSGTCTVRCPMPAHGHPDRTPSLRLYLDDDRYFCFGCGVHGDVVQWVRDAEEVTVIDAVRVLDSGDPIRNAWAASNIHSSEDRPEVRA